MNGKRYGYTSTHLWLTDKAWKAYCESDPIAIYEVEEGDFLFYHLRFGNEKRYGMTEDEVNEYLENLYDEAHTLADRIVDMLDDAINDIFAKIQDEEGITSGDIRPEDAFDLDEATAKIAKIIERVLAYEPRKGDC